MEWKKHLNIQNGHIKNAKFIFQNRQIMFELEPFVLLELAFDSAGFFTILS